MNTETKLTLFGAGSILLLDTTTSLLIVHFHFSSAICLPATLIVYFGMSYWAAKHLNLPGTLAFGAFLGLVDATIGWQICYRLGADWARRSQKITFSRWWTELIWVVMFGVFMALVAFLIASVRTKRESR